MATENGTERERLVLRITPELRARIDLAAKAEAKTIGSPSILTYQDIGLRLLNEALDARGIPRGA